VGVDVASTGAEARTLVRAGGYRLVFLDIQLPDANGLELLKEFRAAAPDAKIVMLSCASGDPNQRTAFENGAWQFVAKPFELSEVTSLARTALSQWSPERRHERHLCRFPLRIALLASAGPAAAADLKYIDATALDIGAAGLRLRTNHPLQPGQRIQAFLVNGDSFCGNRVRSDVPAEVVWVSLQDDAVIAGLRYCW
jgi:two-component system chemotaxis response regulator CheY